MSDPVLLTFLLAAATFSVRFLGVVIGQHLPTSGPWTRSLNALPGCLIVSLVAVILTSGSIDEWTGAVVALIVAIITRNLPVTMIVGIIVVWAMRTFS